MGTNPLTTGKIRASVRGALGTAIAVPLLFSAMPAVAQSQQDEMQQMRQQIQQMQQRMNEMQQRQQAAEQTAGDNGGMISKSEDGEGFMVGNTKIELSGYIKADAVYDFEDDHGISLGPSDAIGTKDSKGTDHPGDAQLGTSVNQTRLKLSTTTPTPIGEIGGYIEMDFFGNGGGLTDSPKPRLRRAYLTMPVGAGEVLVGRDWTTFSDFNYGTTLNFYGPQAQIFERQTQVRYSLPVDDNTTLDFALEDPRGTGAVLAGDGGTAASAGPDGLDGTADDVAAVPANPNYRGVQGDSLESKAPDVVVRLKSSAGPLSFQAAAIGRYLTADINDGTLKGDDDSTFAYGLDLGGSLSLPTGTTLMLSGVYGEGIGKYLYAPAGGPDAYITTDGDLEAFESYGFVGTISQELTSTLTTNVIYGKGFSENPDDFVGSTENLHDESSTVAVNLLYTPVDPLTFGIEYNRSDYERISGENAHAQNVQVSAIYNF